MWTRAVSYTHLFEITPDVAIVDPDLAETMPKKLVAHTGMDAMTPVSYTHLPLNPVSHSGEAKQRRQTIRNSADKKCGQQIS